VDDTDDDVHLTDQVSIYFITQFLDAAETIGRRCLQVVTDFPCSTQFLSDGFFTMEFIAADQHHVDLTFNEDNISFLRPILDVMIYSFTSMSISSSYSVRMENYAIDRVFILEVNASFLVDPVTHIIRLDFAHTRDHHQLEPQLDDALDRAQLTFPLAIIFGSLLLILLTVKYIYSVSLFVRVKSAKEFRQFHSVFWKKLDLWTLSKNSYRYLIVKVAFKMFKLMCQFLMGCLVIYAAYLMVGIYLFGTFDGNFQTWLTGATVLLAVVHEDTIADGFHESEDLADMSRFAGLIYWGIWVFFSMAIMYNVSISIFEEVLATEIANEQEEKRIKQASERVLALE
jgi:hypothetical protein